MYNEIYIIPAFFWNALLQVHSLDIRSLFLDLKLEKYAMQEFCRLQRRVSAPHNVYVGESLLTSVFVHSVQSLFDDIRIVDCLLYRNRTYTVTRNQFQIRQITSQCPIQEKKVHGIKVQNCFFFRTLFFASNC